MVYTHEFNGIPATQEQADFYYSNNHRLPKDDIELIEWQLSKPVEIDYTTTWADRMRGEDELDREFPGVKAIPDYYSDNPTEKS